MAKKKKEEKVTEDAMPLVEVVEKHLTRDELLESEVLIRDLQLRAKDLEMAKKKIAHCTTELTLISANYTLKSSEKETLTVEQTRVAKELENLQNRYKKRNTELAEKYELTGTKWGYDPITGKLI